MQDFINFVRRIASRIAEHVKECVAMLRESCCLWNKGDKVRELYEPVLQSHEKQAAKEFLHHMETGERVLCAFIYRQTDRHTHTRGFTRARYALQVQGRGLLCC